MEQTVSKEELKEQIKEFIPSIGGTINSIEISKLYWLYNTWFETDEQVPKGGCSKCNGKIVLRVLNQMKEVLQPL